MSNATDTCGKEKNIEEEFRDKLNTDKDDDCYEDCENEEKTADADDFIDEVHLKDIELTLSDEDFEDRRSKSLALKEDGNKFFKCGNFTEAKNNYTSALRLCPLKYANDRSVLYANRAASYMKSGHRKEAISDCTAALELNPLYVKAFKRRALLFEEDDRLDEALEDYKKVFEMDPSDKQAAVAIATLPARINEKNEKLKEQMMGTLKDLGNKFLGTFGLSTDNFKFQQDPNTGGYSVNFQQNKN